MRNEATAALAACLLSGALLACGTGPAQAPAGAAPPATLALALPFIEDDFSAALSRAREANLPLFVEVWAPW